MSMSTDVIIWDRLQVLDTVASADNHSPQKHKFLWPVSDGDHARETRNRRMGL